MRWIIAAMALVMAIVGAGMGSADGEEPGLGPQHAVRFAAYDVVIELPESVGASGGLAAWQVSLRAEGARIVGIEGGEHRAFAAPPHYDPRAMMNDRAILAAYSTADDLPRGRTRVARVHVRLDGQTAPAWEASLSVATDADGARVEARVSVMRTEGVSP